MRCSFTHKSRGHVLSLPQFVGCAISIARSKSEHDLSSFSSLWDRSSSSLMLRIQMRYPALLPYHSESRTPSKYAMARSVTVSYTHLRAHETVLDLVCRLLLEKK